jgi:N,N'-diacetylbacillosaminyl-diphospho-undecaprenol alpha-1,3-N-acetylgalactosaminyltransferase
MPVVVHSIHFPVSALAFVAPQVDYLNRHGVPCELWVERFPGLDGFIEQLQVPKRIVATDLSFNPVRFAGKLCGFRSLLRDVKPRVLHCHQSRAALIPLLAGYLERVPIRVYHNHGLPYLGYSGLLHWMLRLMETINLRLATHSLLVSHSNREAAILDGLFAAREARVIADGSIAGVDLDAFALEQFQGSEALKARRSFGISTGDFVLGYVGRPRRRKGFHLLLRAWERTGLGEHGQTLLIAGCTPTEVAAARGRTLPGVKALGYIDDLKPLYAASDVVVLPSDHEGFPYSLLEGAAAGRALIGTDIPGIRCAILNGQTGLLVPPKDQSALTDAIQRLAADPALRSRLGRQARLRVERAFSREKVLADLLKFYQDELGC